MRTKKDEEHILWISSAFEALIPFLTLIYSAMSSCFHFAISTHSPSHPFQSPSNLPPVQTIHMLERAYSLFSTSRKQTFVASRFPVAALTNAVGSTKTMEAPVTAPDDLRTITPEPARATRGRQTTRERSPHPDTDETFVNHDSDAESDIERDRVGQQSQDQPNMY